MGTSGVDEAEDTPEETGPLRRCIIGGVSRPKAELVRFVVSPEGVVVPDIEERLPGRGFWLTSGRAEFDEALRRKAFDRAARRPVKVAVDLAEQVEALLVRRCGNLIGLARRAGQAVAGFEKVGGALRAGRVAVLLAASDGAAGGRDKIAALAPGLPVGTALSGVELGQAFGREFVAHGAIGPGRLADRLLADIARLDGLRRAPTLPKAQGRAARGGVKPPARG
ncbi:MAG TPA: RNA-binding protein [Stellaceae bacterium]|nr:RNA-binding protein [Stellaceae bacterium]